MTLCQLISTQRAQHCWNNIEEVHKLLSETESVCLAVDLWTSRQFKSFMGITAFLSKIENCRGYTWDWRRVTCPVIEANGKLYFFYNRQFGYYFVIIPKMFYYFFQINCTQVYSGETSLTVVSFKVQNNGFARTWIFTYRLVRLQMYHIPIDLNNNSSYYLSAISMLRKDEGLQSILQVWNFPP